MSDLKKYHQVKRSIARHLQKTGWKRKDPWHVLESDFATAIIAFQSARDAAGRRRFTLNHGVRYTAIDGVLKLMKHQRYDPDEGVYSSHWKERISTNCDLEAVVCPEAWWAVSSDSIATEISEQVLAALVKIGIPRMLQVMNSDYIINYWSSGKSLGISDFLRLKYLSILLHAEGRNEELILTLREMKREAPKNDGFNTFGEFVQVLEKLNWRGWHPFVAERVQEQ